MALGLIMELHRDSDDIVARLLEQSGRDAGIDASGHGYNNAHPHSLANGADYAWETPVLGESDRLPEGAVMRDPQPHVG